MLGGLADDGGLYLPASYPSFSRAQWQAMGDLSYEETALAIIRRFIGELLDEDGLRALLNESYAGFERAGRTPLTAYAEGRYLLELYHGPTLAFKDIALQFLARLMEHTLERRQRQATVICATSGDTGSATLAAFQGRRHLQAVALFPQGRISEIQRRQMTTLDGPGVHAVSVQGTFDDAQALLKQMFRDRNWCRRHHLVAVNSINWARILAQAVYYVYAGLRAGALDRPVTFVVPTGNFGDAFAGYVAGQMGLPVNRIVVATNSNDILDRVLRTGQGEVRAVQQTFSPSMDIQVASNFERILFEAGGRNADDLRTAMEAFASTGVLQLSPPQRRFMERHFVSGAASEKNTEAMLKWATGEGLEVDPHTAVGLHAARSLDLEEPVVVLATAHPAKFPDAIRAATGARPDIPSRLAGVLTKPERLHELPSDLASLQQWLDDAVLQ